MAIYFYTNSREMFTSKTEIELVLPKPCPTLSLYKEQSKKQKQFDPVPF